MACLRHHSPLLNTTLGSASQRRLELDLHDHTRGPDLVFVLVHLQNQPVVLLG